MGNIIAAFQGHHAAPWTITERGFCNNVHKLCIPFGIPTMAVINFISGPSATVFFAVFCMAEILSQEFHKWSHTTKSEVPEWVNALQNAGITISRKHHAQHHKEPYEGNYCIISGICNEASLMLHYRCPILCSSYHAQHHKEPYEGNYCIISGICNEALDNSGIFRRFEHIIYNINGVESNAWKIDPKLRERTLQGDYGL